MNAVVESLGKVASKVRVGEHELVFDQPKSVPGGDDRGPSPLDVLVASVAACAHYFAAAYLHGRGLSTEGLAVEVQSEKERLPFSRIGRLTMKVRLPAGLSDRQLTGIERAGQELPRLRDAHATANCRAYSRAGRAFSARGAVRLAHKPAGRLA